MVISRTDLKNDFNFFSNCIVLWSYLSYAARQRQPSPSCQSSPFYLYRGRVQMKSIPLEMVPLGVAGQKSISQRYRVTCMTFFDLHIRYAYQVLKLTNLALGVLSTVNILTIDEDVVFQMDWDKESKRKGGEGKKKGREGKRRRNWEGKEKKERKIFSIWYHTPSLLVI